MSAINCPGCGSEMTKVSHPDITIDQCPDCQGTWMDQGELNVLATGLAGDIEYCAANTATRTDEHDDRQCPRCLEPMEKVGLLRYSDVVLDHCMQCNGFYLDRGELDAVNAELREASPIRADEEFRGEVHGRLVRLDRPLEVNLVLSPDSWYQGSEPVAQHYVQLSVYLKQPVGAPIRISRETLASRLTRALHLPWRSRVLTGDPTFDRSCVIQSSDPEAAKAVVNDDVRTALVELYDEPPRMFEESGTLEVLQNRVVYLEGPLRECRPWDVESDPGDVLKRLESLAAVLEATRA